MSLTPILLADAAVTGAIVVLTPGPAVIAFLGIGAAQGRREGAKFLIGHLVGDLLWSSLALVALVGGCRSIPNPPPDREEPKTEAEQPLKAPNGEASPFQ